MDTISLVQRRVGVSMDEGALCLDLKRGGNNWQYMEILKGICEPISSAQKIKWSNVPHFRGIFGVKSAKASY